MLDFFTEPHEHLACYFNVALGTDLFGRFSSVSGLSYEMEMETFYEGGRNDAPLYFASHPLPQRLVLEGGIMSVKQMGLWLTAANSGMFPRVAGLITLCDADGSMVQNWTIFGAFPVKYEGPTLNALQSSVAVSRIEIIHSGILPGIIS